MICQCSQGSEAIRRPVKGPLKMESGGRGSLDGRGSLLVSPQDCHELDLFLFPAVCQGFTKSHWHTKVLVEPAHLVPLLS